MAGLEHAHTAQDALRSARFRDATAHQLDGADLRDKQSIIAGIAAALDFPPEFGENYDALADSLRDLSWLPVGEHVLIWTDSRALATADPRCFAEITDILSAAANSFAVGEQTQFTVVLTED